MLMAMMELGDMRMVMHERDVVMPVRMRFLDRALPVMLVRMVVGMPMRMVMLHLLMEVEMAVMGSQEEHKAHYHDGGGQDLVDSPALAKKGHSPDGTDKGRGRKECRFARSS